MNFFFSDSERKELKPICNLSHPRSDVCEVSGDIRIHGNSSTIVIASSEGEFFEGNISSRNIKPYARKGDNIAMSRVRTVTIRTAKNSDEIPECSRNYSIPAIVFSTRGYAGNHFHDFSDVLIPLYLTSKEFNGDVQFLITDKQSWWTDKYRTVLQKLSRYELIDMDNENQVLCFPRIILGLKANKEFSIDTSNSSSSMKEYTKFLKKTYSLKRETANHLSNDTAATQKPRLLIISRGKTRRLLNAEEIADVARSLGFKPVIKETDGNVASVAEFVNSFDVMVGVHGAGLTNMVFLPENAVIIQIIPLGGMEWLAKTDFEVPAQDMNLRYLGYKISPEESSLIQQYPYEHVILLKEPGAIYKKGWRSFRSIYLDNQDVKVDVIRFRQILHKAYDLLRT